MEEIYRKREKQNLRIFFLFGVCKKGSFTGELYQRKTFYFSLRQLQLMVMEPI